MSRSIIGRVILSTAIVAASAASALAQGPASANNSGETGFLQLPGRDRTYPFRARDLEVGRALKIFSDNLRIGLSVTGELEGNLTDALSDTLTREQYLDALAVEFDFIWYFDGNVLRVSTIGDYETRIIPLRDNDGEMVIDILRSLDIYQDKFTHRADDRSRTFLVSGPSAYVEVVEAAVEAIEAAERTDITVLRGNEGSLPEAIRAFNLTGEGVAADATPPAVTSATTGK